MKAHITKDGELIIHPESELEIFALREWEARRKQGKVKLIIDLDASDYRGWEGVKAINKLYAELGRKMIRFKSWCEEEERKEQERAPDASVRLGAPLEPQAE